MYQDEENEFKFNDFLQASILMRETALWMEEYTAFGDGLDSDLEYQEHQRQ